MYIKVINTDQERLPLEIVVCQDNNEVAFSACKLGRKCFYDRVSKTDRDVFGYLNEYIIYLEKYNINLGNELFYIYRDIEICFKNISDKNELKSLLTELTSRILYLLDYSKLHMWVLNNRSISNPVSFEIEFTENIDNQWTRDQNYLLHEYKELVTLSIILRAILPIWGEYINHIKDYVGSDLKELYAFQILDGNPILEYNSFIKLKSYINKAIEVNSNKSIDQLTITTFTSSEDLPDLILSLVVIRRLCIGDINANKLDEKATLVSYIYQHIIDKIKHVYSGEELVKEKTMEGGGDDAEGKLSVLESVKIKQDISLGQIAEFEVYLSDYKKLAYNLGYKGTEENLDRWLKFGEKLNDKVISQPTIMMASWIVSSEISSKSLQYIDKITLNRVLSVTGAVMWERGFEYLSLLLLSSPNIDDSYLFLAGHTDTRSQLNKNLIIELDNLYPIYPLNADRKPNSKPINVAIKAIETITNELSKFTWITTVDVNLYKDRLSNVIQLKQNEEEITLIADIRNYLGNLILDCQNRKKRGKFK